MNLGLWDLARDPVLRETLLRREQRAQPASLRVAVPEELATKASEKAAEQREATATELERRHRHHEAIWPLLSRLGWYIPPWQGEGVSYRLPAGPRVPSAYSESKVPVLFLSLEIQKRNAVLALYEPARAGKTEQFLRDHSELIAGITGPPPDDKKQLMWRIAGKGWAGSPEGWPKHIQTIESLTTALAPDLEQLGEIAAKDRIDRPNSRSLELTFAGSPQPSEVVEKKSLWDRLSGRPNRKQPKVPVLMVSCGGEFAMEVKGESHYQEAIQRSVGGAVIEQTSPDACHCEFPVVLSHERTNRYDTNAIAISSLSGERLGYIPRQAAAELAPVLDRIETRASVRCVARAYGRQVERADGWNFGIWLDLPSVDELSEAILSVDSESFER